VEQRFFFVRQAKRQPASARGFGLRHFNVRGRGVRVQRTGVSRVGAHTGGRGRWRVGFCCWLLLSAGFLNASGTTVFSIPPTLVERPARLEPSSPDAHELPATAQKHAFPVDFSG